MSRRHLARGANRSKYRKFSTSRQLGENGGLPTYGVNTIQLPKTLIAVVSGPWTRAHRDDAQKMSARLEKNAAAAASGSVVCRMTSMAANAWCGVAEANKRAAGFDM
jgi:hypothetical protein